MVFDYVVLVKLLVALLCGGIIGLLREIDGKTAGLRTHILVCVGSALFMLISLHMGKLSRTGDIARVAAGVVTGIGFLGAGAIMQAGGSVKGLTTAATIWVTCAIGLAVGVGMYIEAAIVVVLSVFVLKWLRQLEARVIKSKGTDVD